MALLTISIPQETKDIIIRESNYSSLITRLINEYIDNKSIERLKLKRDLILKQYKEELQEIEERIRGAEIEEYNRNKDQKELTEYHTQKEEEKRKNIINNLKFFLGRDPTKEEVDEYIINDNINSIIEYVDEIKNRQEKVQEIKEQDRESRE